MLLSQYNLEFAGIGVALFSVIMFTTLLFWNAYHKSQSGLSKTISGYMTAGIIYGFFSAAFYLTEGLDPLFYQNIGAGYDLMLLNLSSQVMVLFNLIYIRKKTSKTGSLKDIFMFIVYIVNGALMLLYIANAFVTINGQPLYSVLTADGIVYNNQIHGYAMYATLFILLVPFIFIGQAWKRSLPKERVLLIMFALIPWFGHLFKLFIYNGAEMDINFANYSVLGILMVFFDQIQLDDSNQKQAAAMDKLIYEAMHDKLTGFSTADIFEKQVNDFLGAHGSLGCCMALIEIDNFDEYLDIYGRQFCDDVLKSAAAQLKDVVRFDDLTGRVGTQELGVFFKCEVRYFDGLVSKMRDKMDFEHDGVQVSASIGAARVSDNDSDYEYMFALADRTLRQAKKEGAGTYKLTSR